MTEENNISIGDFLDDKAKNIGKSEDVEDYEDEEYKTEKESEYDVSKEDFIDEVATRLGKTSGDIFQNVWNYYVWCRLSELEEKGIDKSKLNEIEKQVLISDKEIPYTSFKYIWKKSIEKYSVIAENVELIEAVLSLMPFGFIMFNKYRALDKNIKKLTGEDKQ